MNVIDPRPASRNERRTRDHYDRLADRASLTQSTRFMNIGYWRDRPATLDDATRAMVRLVADAAQLGPADRVLDVGCGFADQDILWAEEYGAGAIDAVNISAYQLRLAQRAIAARHLSDRIRLWLASATNLPFDAERFDKVVCVEAAHHFDTREAFFAEAHRVLKPGGLLVTADILLRAGRRLDPLSHRLMHIPRANGYASDGCGARLSNLGFTDIELRSISGDVFAPFARFLVRRFASRGVLASAPLAPVRRGLEWLFLNATTYFGALDFVIVSARRAASRGGRIR